MQKNTRAYLLMSVIGLFLTFIGAAQKPNYSIVNFTTYDGLPSNECYSVTQDIEGYLWISTDKGIAKYDGENFKVFDISNGLSNSVTYNLISNPNGGVVFNSSDSRVGYLVNDLISFPFDTDSTQQIQYIKKLSAGVLVSYRTSSKYQIFNWEGKLIESDSISEGFYIYDHPKYAPFSFGNYYNLKNFRILIDSTGAYDTLNFINRESVSLGEILKTEKGLLLFHDNQVTILGTAISHFNTSKYPHYIAFMDSKDQIWSGQRGGGATVYRDLDNLNTSYNYLKGTSISNFFEDKDGSLWLTSTENGIYRFQPSKLHHLIEGNVRRSILKNDSIISIVNDRYISIVHNQNEVLFEAKYTLYDLVNYRDKIAINTFTDSSLELGENFKFIAHPGGRLRAYDNGILYLGNGTFNMIIFGQDSLIENEKIEKGFVHDFLKFQDTLFLGTSKGFYKLWDLENDLQITSILDTPVTAMVINENYRIIGTKGFGIICLDDKLSPIHFINKSNGLTSNYIDKLVFENGNLFVGTSKGVCLIKEFDCITSNSVYTLNQMNGLYSNDIKDLSVKNDTLYISTEKGIQYISIDEFEQEIQNPVPVIISINQHKYEKDKPILIAKGTENIRFKLSTLFFHGHKGYTKEYRLLGYDTNWVQTFSDEVEFSNLIPGEYSFEFRTKLPSNNEYSMVNASLFLEPLITQTMLFKTLLIILSLGLAIVIFMIRDKRIREKSNFLIAQEQLKFKALTSHLNPHFLFNALSSIQSLIITKETNLAAEYLATFSSLLDKVLKNSNSLFVLLNEEIDLIDTYVSVEKTRFELPFELSWKIAGDIDTYNTRIPTMFLQPFIENAILHGLLLLENSGKIDIEIKKKNEKTLLVTIEDNGIGITKAKERKSRRARKSMAIENLNDRLTTMEKLYKESFKQTVFETFDKQGKSTGTTVQIEIPYELK